MPPVAAALEAPASAPSRASRGEIWAWALYDFANSPYSTTITTVVFNVYFVTVVVGAGGLSLGPWSVPGSSAWAYLVAASTLFMAALSPVLGAAADAAASKKRFLAIFTALGCLGTALLLFAVPGRAGLASAGFFAANVGFAGAFTFYNAFLPELVEKDRMGRVSGFGWALGYLGGGLLLAVNLAMIQSPATFGIPNEDYLPVRLSLFSVAVWWALFSIPFFAVVRERASARPGARTDVRSGFKRVVETLRHIRRYPELFKFLAAYLLYNDGIETVIVMAGVFAAEEVGMGQAEIIKCFLMIQAVAFVGSLIFGRLADSIGNKKAILLSLVIWSAILAWALVIRTPAQFWIAGALIGLVLGGSQSASRSLFSTFTPPERSAEFFGFMSLSGKMFATMGPLTFGVARQAFGSVRLATFSILVFFVAGAAVLSRVREEKGAEEGAAATA